MLYLTTEQPQQLLPSASLQLKPLILAHDRAQSCADAVLIRGWYDTVVRTLRLLAFISAPLLSTYLANIHYCIHSHSNRITVVFRSLLVIHCDDSFPASPLQLYRSFH